MTVFYGDHIQLPEKPEKEGYTFSGWGEIPETMPAENIELNGEYTINYYTLVIYLNEEVYEVRRLYYGETIILPDPEIPDGMEFKGWEGEVPQAMPAYDLSIYGTYGVPTGVSHIDADDAEDFTVCTLDGVVLFKNMKAEDVKSVLTPGIYIINGKKVVVK